MLSRTLLRVAAATRGASLSQEASTRLLPRTARLGAASASAAGTAHKAAICCRHVVNLHEHRPFVPMRSLSTIEQRPAARCPGCGATLQSTNDQRLGFVSEKVFENHQKRTEEYENRPAGEMMLDATAAEDDGSFAALLPETDGAALSRKEYFRPKPVICSRCSALRQNTRTKYIQMSSSEYEEEIKRIKNTRGMVLCLVDLFDFPSGLSGPLAELIGPRRPVTLVGNKADLLPQLVTEQRVHDKLTGLMRRVAEDECNLTVASVHLISAKTGFGVHKLFESMYEKCRANDLDILIMGCANAGKSTLVNHLLRDRDRTTASILPGTTISSMDFILQMRAGEAIFAVPDVKRSLGLSKKRGPKEVRVIDTPGLLNKGQIVHMLNPDELAEAIPTKRVVPIVHIVKPGQCLFLGGLARIDFEEGDVPAYFTIFASSKMSVHVTQIAKADEVYKTFAGVSPMMQPPNRTAEDMKSFPPLVPRSFCIEGGGWHLSTKDLVLGGLAWVSFTYKFGAEMSIKAHTPEGTTMYLRDSIDPRAVTSRGDRKSSSSSSFEPRKRKL